MYRDYWTGEHIYTSKEERRAASALDYYDERKEELDDKAAALDRIMEEDERLTDAEYAMLCKVISDGEPCDPCFGDEYDDIVWSLDYYESAIDEAKEQYIALVSARTAA